MKINTQRDRSEAPTRLLIPERSPKIGTEMARLKDHQKTELTKILE